MAVIQSTGRLQVRADARRGDNTPVADEDHARKGRYDAEVIEREVLELQDFLRPGPKFNFGSEQERKRYPKRRL